MDKKRLVEAIERFHEKKIAVVGDVNLDKYVYGRVERVNPENPAAPLLRIERKEFRLGCAANVALNVLSLGADVSLYCAVGNDYNGKLFEELCRKNNIKLFHVREGETIIKERSIESEFNQYLLRADDGEFVLKTISDKVARELYEHLSKEKFDAMILSDYNKFLFRGSFGAKLIEFANLRNIPVIVDPKPVNARSFSFSTLICPNIKEAIEIIGRNPEDEKEVAKKLKEIIGSKYVAITCGKRGIVGFDGDVFIESPTKVREVVDVTGAGDTVSVALTLGLVCGLGIEEAAQLANYAAGVVVEKLGTSTVSKDELIERIREDGNI